LLAGYSRRALRTLLIGGLQASGDERTARRDWRRWPAAARIVKSFTIGAMVAARVHKRPGRRAIGGFTLIELMAVVVIVGILVAIAYPSFMAQVRKSRRAEAVSAISSVAQSQERWRANNATYNTVLTGANSLNVPNPNSGYYTLGVASPGTDGSGAVPDCDPSAAVALATDRDSYSVVATAAGRQANDTACSFMKMSWACGTLRYYAGPVLASLADSATSAAAQQCWSR
jgi:type IV pilus assembly protein PilE